MIDAYIILCQTLLVQALTLPTICSLGVVASYLVDVSPREVFLITYAKQKESVYFTEDKCLFHRRCQSLLVFYAIYYDTKIVKSRAGADCSRVQ